MHKGNSSGTHIFGNKQLFYWIYDTLNKREIMLVNLETS